MDSTKGSERVNRLEPHGDTIAMESGLAASKVLVSMKGYIGDAVMAQPMIAALQHHFATVEIATSPIVSEVLSEPGHRWAIAPAMEGRSLKGILEHARQLRHRKYDIAFLVNRSFRAALIARLAGVRRRIGYADEGRGFLLTDAITSSHDTYQASSLNELIRHVGLKTTSEYPRLRISREEQEMGMQLLDGAEIGIQPGARYAGKQLPMQVVTDLIDRWLAKGRRIVLLGGPDETEASASIMSDFRHGVVDLVGRVDVRTSMGCLANLTRMVGADTGLMHLAAAVGCPTVTVFGPTSPVKWGHRFYPHRIVVAPKRNMALLNTEMVIDALNSCS